MLQVTSIYVPFVEEGYFGVVRFMDVASYNFDFVWLAVFPLLSNVDSTEMMTGTNLFSIQDL